MITVLHVVGKMNRGGLETFVMNVLRNIDTSKFHCDILCTLPGVGDYDADALKCGATLYNIGESFQKHSGKARFVFQFRDYSSWFKRHSYDVVHIHGSHAFDNSIAVKGAIKAGCKRVICHSHTNDGDHKVMNALSSRYLQKEIIIRLACSKQAGKWLYGSEDCFEVIKNGIDVDRFAYNMSVRRKCRASLGIPNNVRVIMNTGRLTDVKNQSFLLHVTKNLLEMNPDGWLLLLAGEGENEDSLRNEACTLEINDQVRFLGLRDDIPDYLSASDIYVMPSIHEGLPLAVVEAQANGLPVILSSGISPEAKILPSTKFMRLEVGPKLWADAITNAFECFERSVNAFQAAADVKKFGFDISQTVNRLQEIYSSVDFS